ncbi:hypothetical protein [Ensifer sp. 4252]|uniref:hypothetical protein n=1 Tax=Ensifer sp. 4252 TaxID=3373915 RepID=UPI003D1F7FA8
MPHMIGRLTLVAMLAFAAAACESTDKKPEPRFVSSTSGAPAVRAGAVREAGYFIEFRSRYALSYGHTYVIFGRTNQSGAMIAPEVAGLAPATSSATPYVLGHFLPVPAETGASDGDLEEEYRSASWRVMLTEAEYNKTVAYIRQLKAKSRFWQASVYNCNAFVADIARSMGYKTPSIWLRPQQFVTKLRQMNAG